jgi:cell filamentation protein
MKRWEDYLQPNGTLRNLLNITDAEILHQLEYDYTIDRQKALAVADYKLPDGYQLTGRKIEEMKLINAYLLDKIYDWAGHYREVDFNKTANGVVTFFHPVALFGNAELDIQRQLDDYAQLPDDREKIAQALGSLVTEINMFHPFREGNGRTTRLFTAVLARQHGFEINYTQEQQAAYMRASVADDAALMGQVFLVVLEG